MAINTAGYLSEKFGLTAFIDSCVWGNSADLLRQIDDKYCLFSDKKSYDYSRRNESTSHVHMMLATALAKMIDRTECVFFLNTPNSITAEEAVERTFSPWIFNELAMISLIRRRTPEAHRPTKKEASFAAKERMDESLLIQYEADFSALDQISHITLNKWDRIYEGWGEALDFLYKLVPQQSVI